MTDPGRRVLQRCRGKERVVRVVRVASLAPRVAAGLGLVALLSSCASSEQDGAVRAADDFVAAVSDGEAGEACALLAPETLEELEQSTGTPCAEAVLQEAEAAGDRVRVSTFGTMSQVRYADDVLFLTHFDAGWLVVAAGCVEQGDGLYSCGIEGR
jgi:hypothetical protein